MTRPNAMKDAIRVVLIDPIEESRSALLQLLGGVNSVWIAEVCSTYQDMAPRIADIAPKLVIVVIDHDPEQAIQLIQKLLQSSPEVLILPASTTRESAVILRVIRSGTREFLTLPATADELAETIDRLFQFNEELESDGNQGPQVIAVTAASGGVGCTSLAVNLATTLAKTSGHEVVLADFDLMLGSIDACLDIISDNTLQGVVQNIDRIDLTLLKRSLVQHSSGLFVLPHPLAMEDAARLDPETLRRVLMLLKAAFPTILIDTSKGLQSSDFVAFEMADLIIVLVQLDLTGLRNTTRLLHLFEQFDGMSDRIRLVINRVGSHESEISLKKAEETLKKPITWQVPNATKLFQASRAKGVPIETIAPTSKAHQAILKIARELRPASIVRPEKPRRGLFAAFL
jgi:pilus assembly protein CpaE